MITIETEIKLGYRKCSACANVCNLHDVIRKEGTWIDTDTDLEYIDCPKCNEKIEL